MLTSLTVKCPQGKEGCNHLYAKSRKRTQLLQEWDEVHFTGPGWGSGVRKKVNKSGKGVSTSFPKLFHQVPRKLSKPTKEFPNSFHSHVFNTF